MVWHGYLPDVRPGPALRLPRARPVRAARRATASIRNKVVLDPYASVIGRAVRWDDSLFGFRPGSDDATFDERDSAPYAPLAAVVDGAFTWGDDRPLRTPWHKTLIYELHVKGFTAAAPARSRSRCAAPISGSRPSRRSST